MQTEMVGLFVLLLLLGGVASAASWKVKECTRELRKTRCTLIREIAGALPYVDAELADDHGNCWDSCKQECLRRLSQPEPPRATQPPSSH